MQTLELVPVPADEKTSEIQIRDVNDRPILRAAIEAKAYVLITGDNDAGRVFKILIIEKAGLSHHIIATVKSIKRRDILWKNYNEKGL